jgi:hypothetical protein
MALFQDFQTECLKDDATQSDVLLECSLSGPQSYVYREHCSFADVAYKSLACCDFCCKALNHVESEHYARYMIPPRCTADPITIVPQDQREEVLPFGSVLRRVATGQGLEVVSPWDGVRHRAEKPGRVRQVVVSGDRQSRRHQHIHVHERCWGVEVCQEANESGTGRRRGAPPQRDAACVKELSLELEPRLDVKNV